MSKETGQGSPREKPTAQTNTNPKEQGSVKKESKERQVLPNAWDILERRVRFEESILSHPITSGKYQNELIKLNRVEDEVYEKGTDRDRIIFELYTGIWEQWNRKPA